MKHWTRDEFFSCLPELQVLWRSGTNNAEAKRRLEKARERHDIEALTTQICDLLEKESDELVRNLYEAILDDLTTIKEMKNERRKQEASRSCNADPTRLESASQ